MATRFPGRICLIGEHCDWYGGASLAASYLADAMRQSPGLPTHQALVAMHNLCTVLTNAGRHYEAVLWG